MTAATELLPAFSLLSVIFSLNANQYDLEKKKNYSHEIHKKS